MTTKTATTKPVDLSWLEDPDAFEREMKNIDIIGLRKSLQMLSSTWATMTLEVIQNDQNIAQVRRDIVNMTKLRNVFNGVCKEGYLILLCYNAGKRVQQTLINELKHTMPPAPLAQTA